MDSVCRLCAKEKPLKQLGRCIDDRTLDLHQKLIDCCRWNSLVPIEYDSLPKRICNACYRKLESSWSFAECVAQAQQELLSMVGDEKPVLAPIEHVNITLVKDEPYESSGAFDRNDQIDSTNDTIATVEPMAKLEVVLKQDELNSNTDHDFDYNDDEGGDGASLSSIEHDTFGTTTTATATAVAGSSKSQSSKSKATKKKPTAKDIVELNRKKSQKLPRSQSCICDTCGKELLHSDGLKRHLKIHANELNYECKTCKKRFLRRDNLRVSMAKKNLQLNCEFLLKCFKCFRNTKIFMPE